MAQTNNTQKMIDVEKNIIIWIFCIAILIRISNFKMVIDNHKRKNYYVYCS